MPARGPLICILFTALLLGGSRLASGEPVTIRIDASRELHRLSPWLAGACIEDVNHEIYGGLYSQMIFGESFQEPVNASPVDGLVAYGRDWKVVARGAG